MQSHWLIYYFGKLSSALQCFGQASCKQRQLCQWWKQSMLIWAHLERSFLVMDRVQEIGKFFDLQVRDKADEVLDHGDWVTTNTRHLRLLENYELFEKNSQWCMPIHLCRASVKLVTLNPLLLLQYKEGTVQRHESPTYLPTITGSTNRMFMFVK